jgi:hypothetical protein
VVRGGDPADGRARSGGREPGKSDPIDAQAVAVAALRHPDLPVAELDGACREVKLLSDYRRDLVKQRKLAVNRLRWHLHKLDPTLQIPPRGCAATASSTPSPNATSQSAGRKPEAGGGGRGRRTRRRSAHPPVSCC